MRRLKGAFKTAWSSRSGWRPMMTPKTIMSRSQAFLCCKAGNVAIVAVILMPAVVGFCGLGTDVAYWYYRQRTLQSAVDVAAYNGAIMLRGGASTPAITTGASNDATQNGWVLSQGTITV